MKKTFFIATTKLTPKIAEMSVPDRYINIEGTIYRELTGPIKGKVVARTLTSMSGTEQFIIYK